MEILQLALQHPELAILDETDSGLDIDALRVVADGVNSVAGPDIGVLIITHYQRILHLVQPSHVHVMYRGRIVREGGPDLVTELEAKGYGWITDELEDGRLRRRFPSELMSTIEAIRDVCRRVPGPAPGVRRPPGGLPGLGGDIADAAGR